MRDRAAQLSLVAIILMITLSSTALGQSSSSAAPCPKGPYPASRTRLFLGEELGTVQGFALTADGQTRPSEGANFYFGIHAGFAHTPPGGGVGFAGLARIGTWDSDWSDYKGEGRGRFDFAVGPAVRFGSIDGRPRSGWHLTAPLGVSIAKVGPGTGRAVREAYSTGYGANLGVLAGYDIAGVHHGATFDLGWTGHVTWIRHDATLEADPGTSVHEHLRYLDHVLALTVGYLYWL